MLSLVNFEAENAPTILGVRRVGVDHECFHCSRIGCTEYRRESGHQIPPPNDLGGVMNVGVSTDVVGGHYELSPYRDILQLKPAAPNERKVVCHRTEPLPADSTEAEN